MNDGYNCDQACVPVPPSPSPQPPSSLPSPPCTFTSTGSCQQGDVVLYAPTQTGPNIKGLLLTWHNNNWGTVCDDVTDCNDPVGGGSASCNNNYVNVAGGKNLAAVVCRSLGNTGGDEYNVNGASSGYPIVVDGTKNHITGCAGNEALLSECKWLRFGPHNCGHHEDVGVICVGTSQSPSPPSPSPPPSSSPTPLPPSPPAPPCTYTLMSDALSWADADAACQAAGLQLATVQSAAQNALLITAAAGNRVWIGGTDTASEGAWVWSPSNTPLSYTNWDSGQPGNQGEDCIQAYSANNGVWHDYPCAWKEKYVCQQPSLPLPSLPAI